MLKVRDIMTADVVTVSPELTLREAMDVLVRHKVSGAPVVANGQVLGVVAASDLIALAAAMPGVPTDGGENAELEEGDEAAEWESEDETPSAYFNEMWSDAGADADERMATPQSPEWNQLEAQTVGDAMTRAIHWLPPEATVIEAAEVMQRAKIHRVLIMEGEVLRGIVSAMDIARAVAEHKLVTHEYVFDGEKDFDGRGY
jgi:CBS domain-containing protein